MAKFAAPAKQAASVMKLVQGRALRSVGTVRNYEERLRQITAHLQASRMGSLRDLTPERALEYLRQRASQVGQKTLDMERQALQTMFWHVTGQLAPGQRLEVVKSTYTDGRQLAQQSRIYTRNQIALITARQSPANALATEIAHAAGLRAHELLTLQRAHRQLPDERPAHPNKFHGIKDGSLAYTVQGKGGLRREVRLPLELVRRLEPLRLREQPREVRDRGVVYRQHYDLPGGQAWSQSFSAASKQALGWSNGAHGLRHCYAQERLRALQPHLPLEEALRVVSQELGHFRPEITNVYRR